MSAGRNAISTTKNWCTPQKYVDAVRAVFGGMIDLDPCSNSDSIVHARIEYMLPKQDGLKESWNYQHIYVNPPYGFDKEAKTSIKDWFAKIAEAYSKGSEIIALVPVATNTSHWKEYVYPIASSICFLYDTKLKFFIGGVEDSKGAPMSCCAIYYGKNVDRFKEIFREYGAVVDFENIVYPGGF